MSSNEKIVLFLIFTGMIVCFVAVLMIVVERYKKIEREKKEDELADAEEINQKILQMHDYGEFLSKELSDKQNEAMLMYEMLLEKEKKIAGGIPKPVSEEMPKTGENHSVGKALSEKGLESSRQKGLGTSPVMPKKEERKQKAESEEPIANHNQEIKALHERGLSEAEIAKELNIGKGQVELVLRLFGNKERK